MTALLGSGFDPGVTQAYCAYAQKHLFDEIDTIDILDCNGGDHGYPFATNFNPAWLHGRAGDLAANALSEYGMTPSDMLTQLPILLKRYNSKTW